MSLPKYVSFYRSLPRPRVHWYLVILRDCLLFTSVFLRQFIMVLQNILYCTPKHSIASANLGAPFTSDMIAIEMMESRAYVYVLQVEG